MKEAKIIPPQKSALFFALVFLAWAGQAFTFQDIGRKHYGEYVLGDQAVACGVIMVIMSVWSTVLFFRRAHIQCSSIRWPLSVFAILVLFAMGAQVALFFGQASLGSSNLAVLLTPLFAWPFINAIHRAVRKRDEETNKIRISPDS